MYVGVLGFPGSGEKYVSELLLSLGLTDLHGTVGWKAMLPDHRPYELVARAPSKEGRNRRLVKNPIPFNPVVHLMRYPWHAISVATELPVEELTLIRDAVGINPKAPACHLNTWESKVKVLTLAFPKWYDMIRELNPDITLKVEHTDRDEAILKLLNVKDLHSKFPKFDLGSFNKPVTYELATAIAGQLAASQVEVIAKNLYKRAPVV